MTIVGIIPAICLFATICLPPPPAPSELLDYSSVHLAEDGTILRVFLNPAEQFLLPWPESSEIPEKLEAAVTESEDRYFHVHPGVNPGAIARAAVQNIRARAIVSGGSTITMQVARILDPKPRNLTSKIAEVFQAIRLELNYSKREILRMYLSYAPYGGNTIGAPAATLRYYKKELADISWSEAATLAVLPRSPGAVFPSSRTPDLVDARNRLLHKLFERGFFDRTVLSHALFETIPESFENLPFEAPHLTRYLYQNLKYRSGVTRTTIDLDMQRESERIVDVHAAYFRGLGIENLSVLIAETGSGRIRTYIGSQDYFDTEGQGNVDGVMAARSSGSILKPFLYALAIDDGILFPQTLLVDIPTHFGTFQPQNVDFAYYGMISAGEALQRSLNVTAVRLLEEYGYRDFYRFLQNAKVETLIRTPSDYGLTLILGGAEVRLFDLVNLYRGLGNYGRFGSLTCLESEQTDLVADSEQALFSEGSASLILDVLRSVSRPEDEAWWEHRSSAYPLAWKTGTSYGNRDAWAIGVCPDWTIGVWVGNFDGTENVNLRSTSTSAPLLFDLFNMLDKQTTWFDENESEFRLDTVCVETGYLAGPSCNHTTRVKVPKSAAPLPVCPYHVTVYLDELREYEVCSRCWDAESYVTDTLLIYPPEAVQYLAERGSIVDRIPAHNPECPEFGAGGNGEVLTIVYPQSGAVIYLPRDFDGKSQEVMIRAAHLQAGIRLFWYLDGEYLGETADRHVMKIRPPSGNREIYIVDEHGEETRVSFEVVVTK